MPRWTPRPRPWITRTTRMPAAAAASMYSETTDGISRGANECRSSSGSIGTRTESSGTVLSRDRGLDAAADREVARDGHSARVDRGHQVIEDLIGHVFVEDAAIPEFDHVVLQ